MELIKAEDAVAKGSQKLDLEVNRMEGQVKEAEFLSTQKDSALTKSRRENDQLKLQLKALLGGGGGAAQLQTTAELNSEENADPNSPSGNVEFTSSLPPSPTRRGRTTGDPSSPSGGGNAYSATVVEAMKQQVREVQHRLELAEGENGRIKQACTAREAEVQVRGGGGDGRRMKV